MTRKFAPSAVAVLTGILVAVTGPAGPSMATTAGALNRCGAGANPDASASVFVPGTGSAFVKGGPNQDPSTPLRNQMRPGDVLRVVASGEVSYGGIFNWYGTWGPNGNGESAPAEPGWPFPGPAGRKFALVGSFNHNGQDVALGTASACLIVPSGGDGVSIPWALWLEPNDNGKSDNGGGYSAVVRVWKSALSP